ncbi:MAG: sulfite exporter TauE/SafE family protein [Acetobacteraceae bacterium]|nr:sulfite exporter TauE/SafE family protein [Acetobacteraceae bacterium]MBV8522536.1 sulfite exporter TauE/SafE family protein [Acetobacteraceae bacterium]
MTLVFLFLAAMGAGLMNALAGGGSFVTLPALMFTGLDARAANITSTIALFPGQVTTGLAGRSLLGGVGALSFQVLVAISVAGGALGAFLLLATPASFFERLLPFLVLFATALFAWGSFMRRPNPAYGHLSHKAAALVQFLISVYGGYFGGGIGFLMLAALTMAGLNVHHAGALKNALAGAMNAIAVVIFAFSPHVGWVQAPFAAVGAILGGQAGVWAMTRVNEVLLRSTVVCIGLALTIGLFVRAW